eukprot:352455-Chlamydomonas_euryale.AAC.4
MAWRRSILLPLDTGWRVQHLCLLVLHQSGMYSITACGGVTGCLSACFAAEAPKSKHKVCLRLCNQPRAASHTGMPLNKCTASSRLFSCLLVAVERAAWHMGRRRWRPSLQRLSAGLPYLHMRPCLRARALLELRALRAI